jgi:hypothetical protein
MPHPPPEHLVGLAVAVVLPALFTLIIGLTHPVSLTAGTAEWWRDLHIVLLPVFPLIGAAPWLVARRTALPWRWLAGLGGQRAVGRASRCECLALRDGQHLRPDRRHRAGSCLGRRDPGRHARDGVRAIVGLLVVVGALLVLKSHVYFPIGTLGLALLIVGGAALALLPRRSAAP